MSKGKLAKFADMATYPHVFECPMGKLEGEEKNFNSQLSARPKGTLDPSRIVNFQFPLRGHWREQFFHNDNPIVLELGCGRGEYAVGLARRYPDRNFIGVDIKGSRMWSGATESLREGLKNVAFLRTNIEIIDRFFAPDEVQEIWLTFSDPQMKKATKRLTSTYFLRRYRRFLVDGGLIHLKTDSNFLFTYTKYVVEENHLPVEACTEDLYGAFSSDAAAESTIDLSIRTYYEQQWLDRGLSIKYLRFRLPATLSGQPIEEILVEPDVDIEPDSYRSYNRERRR